MNTQRRRIEMLKLVAIYSLFGLAWIYGSDTLLGWLVHDPVVLVRIAIVKGSLFIFCTAILLYFLINRFSRQIILAESSQLESLTSYETIFNTTSEAIFVHDTQSGLILDINDRMLEMYGYTRDEALSVAIADLSDGASPYSQAEAAEKIYKTLLEGPQVFEWHSRKKNGELFWSEVSLRRTTTSGFDRIIAVVRDIGERKQLNDALHDAEWKFQALFENGPIGVAYHRMIYDNSGKAVDYIFIDANEKYLELTGVDPRGKTVTQAFPGIEKDPFDWIGTFGKVARNGETIRFEQYLEHNKRWYDCVGYQYKPDHFVAAFLEITERKLAVEALRASELRIRNMSDAAGAYLWEIDIDMVYTYVSGQSAQVKGYSPELLLGHTPMEFMPEEDIKSVGVIVKRAIAEKSSFRLQHRDITPSGELWWEEIYGTVYCDDTGTVIGLRGTGMSINARKQAEEALASSERFLKTIIDTEPECIKMLDADCNLLMMNPAGLKMIEADSFEQVQGQCVSPLITDPYRDAFIALTKQVFQGIPGTLEFETVGLKGRHIWLETHAVPFTDEQGKIVALLGVTRDVTERKNAEAEHLFFEQQLLQTQKLESLGVLAGGIAHDFNNILTAIMGNISYAKMDLDASQHAHEPLVRAEKAAKKAVALARQLLVFSKGNEPIKKVMSVRQSVDDAVSLVLSGSSVKAVIEMPSDLYAVNADEGQISQAFNNIIINAVQAMPDGGVLTVIANNVVITEGNSLGLAAGDYVQISFSDVGCGIEADNIGRIFDPYFTNKTGGSGLGLASTYGIINKHGGHISVSSSPGKGTTFYILIPGLFATTSEELKEDHAPDKAQGDYSILVMDDDEMVRELAEITLKRLGYKVVCCENGAAAASLYRSAWAEGMPYSLVIMDLTIHGGMGGVAAAMQILSFDPEAQLIVSSGYSEDPVMANFADFGFCAALEKPYNVETIARILQKTPRR